MDSQADNRIVWISFPAILEDIARLDCAVIEASAGTGKTYTIEHLLVDLLVGDGCHWPPPAGRKCHSPLPIEQILLVTFTEKAVLELKSRCSGILTNLLKICSKALSGETGSDREEQAESFVSENPDAPAPMGVHAAGEAAHFWKFDRHARERLKNAQDHFEQANIFTIHSFCQRTLKEEAFLAKTPFDQEVVSEDDLFRRVFRKCLRDDFQRSEEARGELARWEKDIEKSGGNSYNASSSLEHLLKEVQGKELSFFSEDNSYFKICSVLKPILERAMEEEKSSRGQIVFDDMLTRLNAAVQKNPEIQRELTKKYRCILVDEFQDTDEIQWSILNALLKAEDPPRLMIIGDPKQSIYRFRGADLCTYEAARGTICGGDLSKALRLDTNFRSSPDLICALNGLFDPDKTSDAFVTEKIEFLNKESGCVEDAKSISSWNLDELRGGGDSCARRTVRKVRLALGQGAGRTVFKEKAGGKFLKSEDSADGNRYLNHADYGSPVVCAGKEGTGICSAGDKPEKYAPLCVFEFSTFKKFCGKTAASKAECFKAEDTASAQSHVIAREIRLLTDPASEIRINLGDGARKVRPGDIFVLVREKWQAAPLMKDLESLGIPCTFQSDKLFESRGALDTAALLRAIASPGDMALVRRAALTPFFGIDPENLASMAEEDFERIVRMPICRWKALADRFRYSELFEQLLSAAAPRRVFAGDDRGGTDTAHVFDVLLDEIGGRPLTIREIIDFLDRSISERPASSESDDKSGDDDACSSLEVRVADAPSLGMQDCPDNDAVRILTIHSSKGLEAPIVFVMYSLNPPVRSRPISQLPGGAVSADDELGKKILAVRKKFQKSYVNKNEIQDDSFCAKEPGLEETAVLSELADSERLIYVAMTRAMVRLYVFEIPGKDRIEGGTEERIDLIGGSDWGRINRRLELALGKPDQEEQVPEGYGTTPEAQWNSAEDGIDITSRLQELSRYIDKIPADGRTICNPDDRTLVRTSYTQLVHGGSAGGLKFRGSQRGLRSTAADEESGEVRASGDEDDSDFDAAVPLSGAEELAGRSPPLDVRENRVGESLEADEVLESETGENDVLPGGAEIGSYVHALFEKIPLEVIRSASSPGELAKTAEFNSVSQREQVIFGISLDEREERRAAELVWNTFRKPVPGFGADGREAALLDLECPIQHEMEFLFPIPEETRASSEQLLRRSGFLSADKGYVGGFIDAVFMDQSGRFWFADWKTNRLGNGASAEEIRKNFQEHYSVQAKIYAVAVNRLLGIADEGDFKRRFGGYVYFYVRNTGPEETGFYVHQPSFQDIRAWSEELAGVEFRGVKGRGL